jgi:hypothetical protein
LEEALIFRPDPAAFMETDHMIIGAMAEPASRPYFDPIILPFSHASEAPGFFFGKSPKSRMDFSHLKCISTYRRRRYVSRTSSALTEFGNEVTTTMNSLNTTVFSRSMLPLPDARHSSLFRDFSHAS